MWNWISAVGVLIELVGFTTLAYDLWVTTKAEIAETTDLANEPYAAKSLMVWEGDDQDEGGIMIAGGKIGKQIEALKNNLKTQRKRMRVVIRGVLISGFGCLLQLVGSLGQAIG